MRSHLLTTVVFIICTSFVLNTGKPHSSMNVLDFNVHRLRGEKVFLSWHTEGETQQVVYEVLRKHKFLSQFVSLGVVQPKFQNDNTADYSFTDVNNYSDSSYYCLKKTNSDSVIFYSITKGVEGVWNDR